MSRRRSADELTTTSFAMLGMLAIRPWSTYELAKHMDRSLGRIWPRARSNLFNEPKKLVAHGLATATDEPVGKRPRTVYSITPAGRRALRRWLGQPGAGPVLEFEQLLKVFFADHGTKAGALAAVGEIKAWAAERDAENAAIARQYLSGEGPFPERAAVLTIMGGFWMRYVDAIADWATWAEEVMADWPADPSSAEPAWQVWHAYAERDRGRPAAPPPTSGDAPRSR